MIGFAQAKDGDGVAQTGGTDTFAKWVHSPEGWSQFRLNLSTTQVKFLKTNGGLIPALAPDGKKFSIDARRIKRISSKYIAWDQDV